MRQEGIILALIIYSYISYHVFGQHNMLNGSTFARGKLNSALAGHASGCKCHELRYRNTVLNDTKCSLTRD